MTCSRILLSAVLFASACAKKKADAPPASAKTTVAGSAGSAAAAEAPKPSDVTIDPQIAQMVKDIVAKCQVDPDYMSVNSCPNSEDFAVIKYAADKKLSNTFESLGEIALTDGAKAPKVFAAIAATWNTFSDTDLEKRNATPAAAERVLKMYPTAAKASSFQYAAAIPLLAGKRAELTAVIKALPPDQQASSVSSYIEWGGAAALPDVQDFFKNGASEAVKNSAGWAVGVAIAGPITLAMGGHDSLSAADKTTLCDWVKGAAADPAASDGAFTGAAESLGRCGGAYIDAALAGIEARLATGKLTGALANNLYHMCWAEGLVGGTPNGSAAQCAKVLELLEKGMAIKDNPASGRDMAVSSAGFIGQTSPPLKAKAKAFVSKYLSDKDLAETAKTALANLKK